MHLDVQFVIHSTDINRYLVLCQAEAPVLGIQLTVGRKGTQYKKQKSLSLIQDKTEEEQEFLL